jgi:hypothetical protein
VNNLRPIHHRPEDMPEAVTAEYWIATRDGVPEVVRVRRAMNEDGDMLLVVEAFGEPTLPLSDPYVREHLVFRGSLALR